MNLRPLLNRLSIRDKNNLVVPLRLNWAQDIYLDKIEEAQNAGKPGRFIILKARQLGISTLTEAYGFLRMFIDEGIQGLVVAHEIDPSAHLLAMTQMFWDTYPYNRLYQTKYESAKQLSWTMGSSLKITTASNAKAGRSRTIQFLHASEVAFWDYAEKTMIGLRQTIPNTPGTFIAMESTANGVGNYFHQQWEAAEEGETDFTPIFLPWHNHPEYLASQINIPYHALGRLDEEERALRSMGLSDDRLAWRRWAIKNLAGGDINSFHQEYPSTPEEAFIFSGSNVFKLDELTRAYEPILQPDTGTLDRGGRAPEFRFDIGGPLKIFRRPSRDRNWGQYLISADPTRTTEGDYAAAQVINMRTLEQAAVWRAKVDPATFAEELAKLGQFYNDALLVPELEGPGGLVIGQLLGLGYPRIWRQRNPAKVQGQIANMYGWSSNVQSKPAAIGALQKLLHDKATNASGTGITIHDPKTFNELKNYVVLEGGVMGPGVRHGNDDLVTSMAIGAAAWMQEPPLAPYGGSEQQSNVFAVPGQTQPEPPWTTWGEDVPGAS